MSKNKPRIYGQLIIDKDARTIQWIKSSSLINGTKNIRETQENTNHDTHLISLSKINSKRSFILNVNLKITKLLEENRK